MSIGTRPIGSRGIGDNTAQALAGPAGSTIMTGIDADTVIAAPLGTVTHGTVMTGITADISVVAPLGQVIYYPDFSTVYLDHSKYPDIQTLAYSYPVPVLTAGVPSQDFTASRVAHRAAWGKYGIRVNGQDVTLLRGKPTVIANVSESEPYGWEACELHFQQVTIFDRLGAGDLTMFPDQSYVGSHPIVIVDIWHVNPDGTTDHDFRFQGLAATPEYQNGHLILHCIGICHQLDMFVRAPALSDVLEDIGTAVAFNFNPSTRPILIDQMAYVVTGLQTRDRGTWDQGVLNYIDRQLAKAIDPADGKQWTVHLKYDKLPVLEKKNTTSIDYVIWAGMEGLQEGLTDELTLKTNVWYGEGEDEAGTGWRNSFPSDDGESVFFQPVAYDPAVHPFDDDNQGHLTSHPGRIVPGLMRIEGHAALGQSISKAEATPVLAAEIARMAGPGWVGTIKLTIDVMDNSGNPVNRRDIHAGKNILIKGFGGIDTLMHIAKVEITDATGKADVQLTIDKKGRDISLIQALIDRRADQVKNPMARLLVGRGSVITKDQSLPWDTSAGAGWCPRKRYFDGTSTVHVPYRHYAVQRILVGEEVTIVKTEFQADSNNGYGLYVFNQPPVGCDPTVEYQLFNPATDNMLVLGNRLPTDPFAIPIIDPSNPPNLIGPWDGTPPDYMICGWGQFGQGAGFYPNTQAKGGRPTGHFIDEGTWSISHKSSSGVSVGNNPVFVWIAFWSPSVDMHIAGRLYVQAKSL